MVRDSDLKTICFVLSMMIVRRQRVPWKSNPTRNVQLKSWKMLYLYCMQKFLECGDTLLTHKDILLLPKHLSMRLIMKDNFQHEDWNELIILPDYIYIFWSKMAKIHLWAILWSLLYSQWFHVAPLLNSWLIILMNKDKVVMIISKGWLFL